MSNELRERRQRFDAFCDRLHQEFPYKLQLTCPCCGYPTLTHRGSFEMCPLCIWEDDGQDEPDANEVRGGPNSDYSLSQARHNFELYWIMYSPDDTRFGVPDSELTVATKKLACQSFDQMIGTDDATQQRLLKTVKECFMTLDAERKREDDEYEAQFGE